MAIVSAVAQLQSRAGLPSPLATPLADAPEFEALASVAMAQASHERC